MSEHIMMVECTYMYNTYYHYCNTVIEAITATVTIIITF